MTTHLLNICLHIGAGCVAIAIGFWLLAQAKGTARHRRGGRLFAWFALLVCATAAIGNAVFRFMPLFAVLTLLVLYQLLSGWHAAHTRERGPDRIDALLCAGAALLAVWLVAVLASTPGRESAPVVVQSTLATLFALIAYDGARWMFPRRWHGRLWLHEHIYKLVSSLFAMLSAALGNLLPHWQPWSQLLPSAAGLLLIALFMWRHRHGLQSSLASRTSKP